MSSLEQQVLAAQNDRTLLEQIFVQYQNFILKCASSVTKRYVSVKSDEYAVAMSAFSQAIVAYRAEKGSFYPFAELVIRRELIDSIRAQVKYAHEIPVSPAVFNSDAEEEEGHSAIRFAVAQAMAGMARQEEVSLKLEIEAANQTLSGYGFSFYELTECSPKAKKTKLAFAAACAALLGDPALLALMRKKKQLPIHTIEEIAKVPRKILEHHRKYIIAAAEILSGEYPCLADYLQFIREGLKK